MLSGRNIRKRATNGDLAEFCFQLSQLLSAGFPLANALKTLGETLESPALGTAATALASAVNAGTPLSSSLRTLTPLFPDTMIAVIQAAENAGRLRESLERLECGFSWQQEQARLMRKAMSYPAIAILVGLAAGGFVIGWLLPQLAGLFSALGAPAPLPLQLLLQLRSGVIAQWPMIILLVLLTTCVVGLWLIFDTSFRFKVDRIKSRAPVIGGWIQERFASEFSMLLCLLYESGLPLTECLILCSRAQSSPVMAQELKKVARDVSAGHGLNAALKRHTKIPHLLHSLIGIGESTGTLGQTLARARDYFRRKCQHRTEKMIAMIEPALTLTMGIFMASLIAMVMLPVYDLIAKMGR